MSNHDSKTMKIVYDPNPDFFHMGRSSYSHSREKSNSINNKNPDSIRGVRQNKKYYNLRQSRNKNPLQRNGAILLNKSDFLPDIRNLSADQIRENRLKWKQNDHKPELPKQSQKPIFGLSSNRNYVQQNERVGSTDWVHKLFERKRAKTIESEKMRRKLDLGKLPNYLISLKREKERKMELEQKEKERLDKENTSVVLIDPMLREELREGIREKIAMINKEYQMIIHHVKFESIMKKKKEKYERELDEAEESLMQLNKE